MRLYDYELAAHRQIVRKARGRNKKISPCNFSRLKYKKDAYQRTRRHQTRTYRSHFMLKRLRELGKWCNSHYSRIWFIIYMRLRPATREKTRNKKDEPSRASQVYKKRNVYTYMYVVTKEQIVIVDRYYCDSVVGASHLNTLNNASRATCHVNNFAIGKEALSVTKVNPGNLTSEKTKEKLCSTTTITGVIVTGATFYQPNWQLILTN